MIETFYYDVKQRQVPIERLSTNPLRDGGARARRADAGDETRWRSRAPRRSLPPSPYRRKRPRRTSFGCTWCT